MATRTAATAVAGDFSDRVLKGATDFAGPTDFLVAPTALMPVETVIAARTLTAADSGKTFILSLAGGFNVTLPAPARGLFFRFFCGIAPTTAYTITTNGTTQNVMHGTTLNGENSVATNGSATSGTGVDVLTFVANKAQIGDFAELCSDGTSWFAIVGITQQDAATLA